MEHPLSRSATWLSSVLEASLSGVLVFEPVPDAPGQVADYRAVFANRAVGELIGTTPEIVVGNNLGNLFPNDAVLRLHFDRVVTRGEAQRFEFEHHNSARPGLGRTWFDASVNGLDGHVVMSFIDVTATRQVESQAEKTIARLHSILDGSPAAIGLLEAVRDPNDSGRITDFTIVSLNEQFCSLMKYEAADLIGRRFRKLFKRSLTAKLYDRFVRVVETGVPLREELFFEKGPLQGWFDLTAVRQGDGLTITVLDVTAYREAEAKARQTAFLLETVLDRAQAGVTWHKALRNAGGDIEDFQVVAINEASAEFFTRINPDLRGQALAGRRLSQFFPQAWDLGLFDRFVNVVETGEPVRYERTYPTEEGDLWFDVSAVKEDDGLILTFVDITRLKEAELEAEATAELLGGVFDASPWAIVYLVPEYDAVGDVVDFTFQLANAKAEDIGRQPLPELVGGRMLEMYPHTRDVGLFEEYLRVLETGRPFEREVFYEGEGIARWSHITAVRQGEGLVLTNSDVTARKLAEIQNEESLHLLQGVLSSAPTAIFWLEAVRDPAEPARIQDFTFALFNAHTAELARRPAADLHAQRLRRLFPHSDNTGLLADYVRVVETGEPLQRDVFYDWDGVHGWFHLQAARHGDGVVVQALDITERKRAEQEALRLKDETAQRAEDRYQALFTTMAQGFYLIERVETEAGEVPDFRYVEANPAFEHHTGLREVVGKTSREVLPDADPRLMALYDDVLRTRRPQQFEAYIAALGLWMEASVFPTPTPGRLAVLFSNITERKRVEEALRQSEEKFRAFVGATSDIVYEMSADWREMHFLQGKEFIATTENPRGDWTDQYIPDDEKPRVWAAINHAIQTQTPFELEHRVVQLDGSEGWTFSRVIPRFDGRGNIAGWFGAASDVTERRQAEEALRASEEKYRSLFNSIDEGFSLCEMITDENGEALDYRFLELNPAFERMAGIRVADAQGRTVREVVPGIEDRWIETYARAALAGEVVRFENHVAVMDRWFEVFASPLNSGTPNGKFIAVFRDITERKLHEQRQAFLLKLSDALRVEPDADAVANRALRMLSEQLRLDRCYVAVYRPGDDHADFTLTHQTGNDLVPPLPEAFRVVLQRTLVIDDFAETTEGLTDTDRRDISTLGLRALLAATLSKGQNNPHWVIVAAAATPRRWTGGEIALLEEATERTWAAMERARAETALRASEARLQKAMSIETVGVLYFRLDGRVTHANEAALRLFGYDRNDLLGIANWETLSDPEFLGITTQAAANLAARGETPPYEKRMVRPDGSRWWGLFAPTRLSGEGRGAECVEFIVDITETKRTEEALRQSEERLRVIIEGAQGYAIFTLTADGRVDSWNAGAAAIFGWSEADIIGQPSDVLFTPEDRALNVPQIEMKTAATEGVAPDVRWHQRRDGSSVFINGVNQALLDAGGQLRGFVKIGRDMTRQHEAEEALRKSEERLRLAVDAADMATWEWHLATDEVYWDGRHFALFGITPRSNPLKSGDFFDHLHPDDRERVGAELRRAIADRSVFDTEFRAVPDSGEIRWISGYGRVTDEADGQPTRMSGVMLDITARKRAEEQLRDFAAELERQVAERTAELRKSLTLLQQTEGVARMGSWAYTPATGSFEWSAGMYRLFGLEPGAPVSPETYLDFTLEADQPVAERIVAFLKHPNGHELEAQFCIRTAEGEKTVRVKATVQHNAAGELERVLGVDIDITAQVEAEQQLSESARTLRNILDGAQAGITLLKADRDPEYTGPIVDFVVENANHLAAELNGIPMEQTLGRRCSELFPHYKTIGLFDRYVEVVETGISQRFEARNEGPGPVEWFDVSLGKHDDGVVLTFSDISHLKRLQLQHYSQATMLEGILDSAANSLGVYDALRDEQGRITDFRVRLFNRAALQAARLTWADVEGKTLLEISPRSKEIGIFNAAIEVVETGQFQQLTCDYPHLGKSFSIALSRFNRDGLIVGSVDITELRKAQRHQEELLEDLRKSNLNLEQFAYVTSHDLQEPLRKIQSFGTMLAKRLGDRLEPTEADLIHRMQDAATRMKTLIEDLLTFSRLTTKKEAFRWLHLDRLVREVLGDLESTIQEKNARVHVGPLPRLKGDAMQWQQLLQNLLSNALKFSRNGVVPEVRVEARTVSATDCPDTTGLRESQTYWELTVADNGIGFDDQYREKIFDMFQRLHGRAEYSGTGIGLAIAKKVAEQHGGCVSAHGVPGQGATFRVYVPTPPETAETGD